MNISLVILLPNSVNSSLFSSFANHFILAAHKLFRKLIDVDSFYLHVQWKWYFKESSAQQANDNLYIACQTQTLDARHVHYSKCHSLLIMLTIEMEKETKEEKKA